MRVQERLEQYLNPRTEEKKWDYKIERLTGMARKTGMAIIVKYHYLHRKTNFCTHMYGLCSPRRIEGVCTFILPVGVHTAGSIAGKEHAFRVRELSRLWIRDDAPQYSESWFVSRCFKMMKQTDPEIYYILSFSDPSVGHRGTIYQALNFLYLGMTNSAKIWTVEGTELHNRHISGFGIDKMRRKYGSRLKQVESVAKHRYIYINARGGKRKRALKDLKYRTQPFPKEVKS